MIAYLEGKIFATESNAVVLMNNGVGYRVLASPLLITKLKKGDEAAFHIHHHIREDASTLFGFQTREEVAFFQKLLSVSGVGPKSALAILAVASPDEIRNAVGSNDSSILTKVSGIGQRTAERIIVELKEKVDAIVSGDSFDVDVFDALIGLGYPANQVRDAIRKISKDITDTQEKIKAALKVLGSK